LLEIFLFIYYLFGTLYFTINTVVVDITSFKCNVVKEGKYENTLKMQYRYKSVINRTKKYFFKVS